MFLAIVRAREKRGQALGTVRPFCMVCYKKLSTAWDSPKVRLIPLGIRMTVQSFAQAMYRNLIVFRVSDMKR
jgi:hypothetical protein